MMIATLRSLKLYRPISIMYLCYNIAYILIKLIKKSVKNRNDGSK
jgi:hypothetical protein